jgi:hypothetical protein
MDFMNDRVGSLELRCTAHERKRHSEDQDGQGGEDKNGGAISRAMNRSRVRGWTW